MIPETQSDAHRSLTGSQMLGRLSREDRIKSRKVEERGNRKEGKRGEERKGGEEGKTRGESKGEESKAGVNQDSVSPWPQVPFNFIP